jgi:hypothetical protein
MSNFPKPLSHATRDEMERRNDASEILHDQVSVLRRSADGHRGLLHEADLYAVSRL